MTYQPGVYEMDEATYHQDPVPGGSLSASGAKLLLPPSCPALYAWRRDHPKVSAEFDFGIPSLAGILDPIAARVLKETIARVVAGLFDKIEIVGDEAVTAALVRDRERAELIGTETL